MRATSPSDLVTHVPAVGTRATDRGVPACSAGVPLSTVADRSGSPIDGVDELVGDDVVGREAGRRVRCPSAV